MDIRGFYDMRTASASGRDITTAHSRWHKLRGIRFTVEYIARDPSYLSGTVTKRMVAQTMCGHRVEMRDISIRHSEPTQDLCKSCFTANTRNAHIAALEEEVTE